jgi:putative membrane protein
MRSPAEQDPRVYFAAQRTLLAWIRTGLALMGFGFAIARFGLFLREMQASETRPPVHSTWGSPFTGVTLIALAVFLAVLGAIMAVYVLDLH